MARRPRSAFFTVALGTCLAPETAAWLRRHAIEKRMTTSALMRQIIEQAQAQAPAEVDDDAA